MRLLPLPSTGKYQILYTDYENFAIFYACNNYFGIIGHTGMDCSFKCCITIEKNDISLDQIWLMGRLFDYEVEIRQKVYAALELLGLDPERLTISKNDSCPALL